MKKYIFSVCALALGMFAASCSDFLDEDPKGQLAQDNFFTSQSDLDMAVNALYRQVCNTSTNTNAGTVSWMGDDLTTNPGSNKQHFAQMVKWSVADDSKGTTNLWKVWYSVIKAANYIILNADRTPVSETEIKIAKGQAHYWRAVAYFSLVRPFGPIPMNLTNEIDVTLSSTPVADVYKQIEEDLTTAKSYLPTSYSAKPRQWEGVDCWITKQAAAATLASVYLTEAGWPLNQGQSTYAKAASEAKEVISGVNSGTYKYEILADYKEVYSLSKNYNNETVVGINTSNNFTWAQDCEMGVSNIYESQGGWGDAWATYSYWKKFPEGARKEATFMPQIMILVGANKGKLVNFYDKDEAGNFYIAEHHPCYQVFCASKDGKGDFDYTYANGTALSIGNACTSQRIRLVRYSEVLLWYAEASTRATGSVDELALQCLNKVRTRAGEEAIPSTTSLSASDFADLCAEEHGYEVAGYFTSLNTRRFDIQRLGKMQELYNQRKADHDSGVEVAPGVVLKEDMGPEVAYSESLIYHPKNNVDVGLNPNIK